MSLKDAKADNVGAWAVASLVGGVALDTRTPLPVQLDVALCALVFGDVALAWFMRDALGKWWHPHRVALHWVWVALRVTFTRDTWRDVRATARSAKQRRAVRGTAGELLALVDDPRAPKHALPLLQHWVRGAAPIGTGDAWVEVATPRSVRKITETATGVEMVVAMAAKADSAKKVMSWAGGIESQAGLARGALTISQIDGQPPHVTLWQFRLRPAPKAGTAKVTTGRSIADGVTMGVDATTGTPVVFPIVGYHALTAGITNAGKSNGLSVEAEQVAACDDGELWVIDHLEGMSWLRPYATRYYSTITEAVSAIDDITAEFNRRNAFRRSTGDPDIPPSPEWPHIRIIFDEVVNVFVAVSNTKDRARLIERWAEFMRLSRKEGMTVNLAPQRITDDVLPRELSTQCLLRIGLTLPEPESRILLQHGHIPGRMDCSTLRPKSGEACVMLPGDTSARRVNIFKRAERGKPLPPPAGAPAVGLSAPLSEPAAGALSTALSEAVRQPDDLRVGGEGEVALSAPTADPTQDRRMGVLWAVGTALEPVTPQQIADALKLGRTTILPTIKALEDEGQIVNVGNSKRQTFVLGAPDAR